MLTARNHSGSLKQVARYACRVGRQFGDREGADRLDLQRPARPVGHILDDEERRIAMVLGPQDGAVRNEADLFAQFPEDRRFRLLVAIAAAAGQAPAARISEGHEDDAPLRRQRDGMDSAFLPPQSSNQPSQEAGGVQMMRVAAATPPASARIARTKR